MTTMQDLPKPGRTWRPEHYPKPIWTPPKYPLTLEPFKPKKMSMRVLLPAVLPWKGKYLTPRSKRNLKKIWAFQWISTTAALCAFSTLPFTSFALAWGAALAFICTSKWALGGVRDEFEHLALENDVAKRTHLSRASKTKRLLEDIIEAEEL